MIQIVQSNIGWIILLVLAIGIFLYKIISKNPDAVTSKFKTTQTIHSDFNTSFVLIKEALENARFSKVNIDEDGTKINARSGFSMSSWSEYIQVKIHRNADRTEFEFKSICALPTQIFDWGKNKRNYKRFEKELNKLIAIRTNKSIA